MRFFLKGFLLQSSSGSPTGRRRGSCSPTQSAALGRLIVLTISGLCLTNVLGLLSAATTQIAFVGGTAGGSNAVYFITSDGSGLTPLLMNASEVDWSPDGAKIVFSAADSTYRLYTCRIDGTELNPLGVSGSSPRWSPDGRRIAFVGAQSSSSMTRMTTMEGQPAYVVNYDGSGLQAVGVNAQCLDWSPDSLRLVFSAPPTSDLYLVNADGMVGGLTPLGVQGYSPRWSNDGTRIAFSAYVGNNPNLCTVRTDGTDLRFLGVAASSCGLDWFPDDSRLVFCDTQENLYTVAPDGTDVLALGVSGSSPTCLPAAGAGIERFGLSIVSGNNQRGMPGKKLANPLVVAVDKNGTPVQGISVHFAVKSGGGSVSISDMATNAQGQAGTELTLGPAEGTNTVEATTPGYATVPVTFAATGVIPAAPSSISLTADPLRVLVGGSSTITCNVKDQFGNFVPGASVGFQVTAGSGLLRTAAAASVAANERAATGATAVSGAALTGLKVNTDDGGDARVILTGVSAGTNTVKAGVLGATGVDPKTVDVTGEYEFTVQSGLRITSFPFAVSNGDPAFIFNRPADQLSIAAWDGTAGKYVTYDGTNVRFQQGQGLWTAFVAPVTARIAADPTRGPVAVAAPKGWFLLGNPYNADFPWDATRIRIRQNGVDKGTLEQVSIITATRIVESYAWAWDTPLNAYRLVFDPRFKADVPASMVGTMTTTLKAGEGAFFMVNSTGIEIVLPPPTTGLAEQSKVGRQPAAGDQRNWSFELQARAGDATETGNVLGVTSSPLSDKEGFRAEKAPLAANTTRFVEVALLGPNPDTEPRRLSWDLRPPITASGTFDFVVTTNVNGEDATLTWPNLSAVPKNYRLYLTDLTASTERAMRTTSAYRFPTNLQGYTQRRFRITVTAEQLGRLRISNVSVASVRRAQQAAMRMTYVLNQPATVQIRIMNTGGRLVAVLPAAALTAGLQSAVWDGQNRNSRSISRGVYLVEFAAANELGEQVRAVRRVTVR